MAQKIRLARGGAKKKPFYRIVVADSRSPRDGKFLERVGSYNPMVDQGHAERVVLNEDRIKHWLSVGAQPTDRVARILGTANIITMPERRDDPKQSKPKAKAQERMRLEAEAAATAAEEAMAAEGAPTPETTASETASE